MKKAKKVVAGDPIVIDVVGGMCQLEFRTGSYCGQSPDSNPGVGFSQAADVQAHYGDGKWHSGTGVFSRSDAKRLADSIYAFLKENPPVK